MVLTELDTNNGLTELDTNNGLTEEDRTQMILDNTVFGLWYLNESTYMEEARRLIGDICGSERVIDGRIFYRWNIDNYWVHYKFNFLLPKELEKIPDKIYHIWWRYVLFLNDKKHFFVHWRSNEFIKINLEDSESIENKEEGLNKNLRIKKIFEIWWKVTITFEDKRVIWILQDDSLKVKLISSPRENSEIRELFSNFWWKLVVLKCNDILESRYKNGEVFSYDGDKHFSIIWKDSSLLKISGKDVFEYVKYMKKALHVVIEWETHEIEMDEDDFHSLNLSKFMGDSATHNIPNN